MSQPTHVDPRGLRFVAGITAVVLAVALILPVAASVVLLAAQGVVFAIGAFANPQRSPYALAFATFVRPRIGAPQQLEDARPPRFAQLVGFAFMVVALAGFLSGVAVVGYIATAFALIAALLNSATGFCLGCEMYLTFRRFGPAKVA